MFKPNMMVCVIALALLPAAARAQQTNQQLEEIRKQIQEMKDSYDTRIQALEKQLKEAEEAAAKAQTAATQAQSAAGQAKQSAESATQATGLRPPASPSAFNPGLSLILMGGYYNSDQDPRTRTVTGFLGSDEYGLPDRGFDLGETELQISANVDHLFYGQATFAIEDGAISAEEAFFQTTAIGYGLTVKGGRFFSSIGYFNSVHNHAWDFQDPALVQKAFLGDNFGLDGVQVSWIAPLSAVYIEVGGEGGKPVEFPFPDSFNNKNGFQVGTLFAHLGGDIGASSSYRFGVWGMTAENGLTNIDQPIPALDFTNTTNTLTGGSDNLWGLDFVYKWAPNGDPSYQNFKFVAEWMHRSLNGTLTSGANTGPFIASQSGWYVQGVYQFHPYWRVGLRYDQMNEGSYDLGTGLGGAPGLTPPDFTPRRWSAMVDWSPSEFSRFRLQFQQDKSQQGLTDNQVFLQYIFSLGTHGAHKF
ncbi:MAG TPA: TonB-dependent receptor [Burkholderiales bacterium]|nr:TonB-dependent receptor [Burkholderiales bacterium]